MRRWRRSGVCADVKSCRGSRKSIHIICPPPRRDLGANSFQTFWFVVLPIIGDRIGAFFFSAPEEMEVDELTKAAAKVTQGDYEGAIKAYKAIAQEDPDNRFPIFEIAKIHHEHLRDIDSAIKTFEDSLASKEWAENDAAAMMFRLQQIYLEDKQDEEQAEKLLEMVIEKFPETRHSANAHHRLNELKKIG